VDRLLERGAQRRRLDMPLAVWQVSHQLWSSYKRLMGVAERNGSGGVLPLNSGREPWHLQRS
jgi:hypothetical protein